MSEKTLEIMVLAGSAPGIQIMNPAPAFCNRLTEVPVVLGRVAP
jgi:hypothetical protein